MDLSIFDSGLSTKAYLDATKKRTAKKKTNADWLKTNRKKLKEMRKEQILNNVVRQNQSTIDGKSYMFRLVGFLNKTLTLNIKGKNHNVIPFEDYESSIQAYATALSLYEEDADFQQSINNQLKKHGADIVPLEVVS